MSTLNITTTTTTTENGRPSLLSTGDSRVDAFFKLTRGLEREALRQHVAQCVETDPVDAFVLWANTRDVRGGKGERDLVRWWFVELAQRFPLTAEALVLFIPLASIVNSLNSKHHLAWQETCIKKPERYWKKDGG